MKFRLHLFEDAGFSARALVTRPDENYQLDVWASDVAVFGTGDKDNDTTPDAWLNRILRGIRATKVPCHVHVTGPNTQPQHYLITP